MKTPPFKSLYYFSIVAEKKSIKAAAESLFVTQAAVSLQIKALEAFLGLPVFTREHRLLTLTPAGIRLLPFLQQSFATLNEGIRELSLDSAPNTLTLSILPSFASRWLIPRLGSFHQQFPEIKVNLSMTEQLEDFSDGTTDLAIRFSSGDHENLASKPLMKEYLYAVCHPDYCHRNKLKTLDDLKDERLIDDEDSAGYISWSYWLKKNNGAVENFTNRQRYNGSHYVVDSALSKQGVAVVRHSLAAESIKQGNLVRLFDSLKNGIIEIDHQFYACAPAHHFQREKVQHFSQWLQDEALLFYEENPI